MSAQTLDGMPRRLFSCTPSRLAAFDCPRRYRFAYLDRPRPRRGRPWAHNSVGAATHLALARWWSLPLAARSPGAGADLVRRNWAHDGFRDEQQSTRFREAAAGWVEAYLADVDPADEPLGVERTVAVPTQRLALNGRVDRIDERAGDLVIVDYKTGRHAPDVDDARGSQALALYAIAASRVLRRPCRRVELHHLPSGTCAVAEHTEQSLQRHLDRAEASAQDIVAATDTLESGAEPDAVFPAMPGPVCSWCDFREHCPEGRAASTELQPWAGLAALDA